MASPIPWRTPSVPNLGREIPSSNLQSSRNASRVLLVDDHIDTLDALSRLLKMRGYAVTCARSAEDALAICRHDAPDVLVSDVGLPGMTGVELMKQLTADGIPVAGIALTGYQPGVQDWLPAVEQSGFSVWIMKPVDLDKLEAALCRVTNRAIPQRREIDPNSQRP